MQWINLTSIEQLEEIQRMNQKVLLFKHSTRCPISSMAKRGLEFDFDLVPQGTSLYLLDLIRYREISNTIAECWNVKHESPQLLIVQGADCIYHVSHEDIDMAEAVKQL